MTDLAVDDTAEGCDNCGTPLPVEDRWVVRTPRPSCPQEWTAILWLCEGCALGDGPEGDGPGSAHQEPWWDAWIESDAGRQAGALWLT